MHLLNFSRKFHILGETEITTENILPLYWCMYRRMLRIQDGILSQRDVIGV